MNRVLLSALTAVAACALAPSAYAVTETDFIPGSPQFQVSPDPETGEIAAAIARTGIAAGDFIDTYFFEVFSNGLGSGSVATSTARILSRIDLDITSVFVNNIMVPGTKTNYTNPVTGVQGETEVFELANVPISLGDNFIRITGTSRGNGSYGGNLTFSPAVPETGTWAMMIIGFGAVGAAMRYRRRQTKVAYAA